MKYNAGYIKKNINFAKILFRTLSYKELNKESKIKIANHAI